MKILLLLLTITCTHVWADPSIYRTPTVTVSLTTAISPTADNLDTLRQLALAKAATENLPTILQQAMPSLTAQQAQARATTVAAGTDWLASYSITDETLTPHYALRVALVYQQSKVNTLLAAPSPANVSPSASIATPSPYASSGSSAPQNTSILPLQTLTLTLEGTPAQGAKLQTILATHLSTTSQLFSFTVNTLTYTVTTPSTAPELADFLSSKDLTPALLTANSLRVVF